MGVGAPSRLRADRPQAASRPGRFWGRPRSCGTKPVLPWGKCRLARSNRRLLGATRLRLFQHVVVRRWLVFVIVRLDVILAHREILETIPHEDAPQVGMAVEDDAVKVECLTLLKFRAAPERRERWHMNLVSAVRGAKAHNNRAVLQRH